MNLQIRIDSQGHLPLPQEILSQYNLREGDEVSIVLPKKNEILERIRLNLKNSSTKNHVDEFLEWRKIDGRDE